MNVESAQQTHLRKESFKVRQLNAELGSSVLVLFIFLIHLHDTTKEHYLSANNSAHGHNKAGIVEITWNSHPQRATYCC